MRRTSRWRLFASRKRFYDIGNAHFTRVKSALWLVLVFSFDVAVSFGVFVSFGVAFSFGITVNFGVQFWHLFISCL